MITEIKFMRDKRIAKTINIDELPVLPRIGESVCLENGSKYFKVVDVVYSIPLKDIKIYLA